MLSNRDLRVSLSAALFAALASACSTGAPTSPTSADTALYALVTTIDGVSFDLPLGPGFLVGSAFDAALLSRLQVVVEGTTASGDVASSATFDQSTSPVLRVVPEHESYFLDIPAAAYFTNPALAYRVRVLLDGREIARSDLSDRVFTVMATVPNLTVGVKVRIEDRTAPRLDAVTPSTLIAGSGDTEVTVTGDEIARDTIFRIGSVDLASTQISPARAVVTIPASFLASPGALTLTAVTLSPGGGSASIGLTVVSGVATLTSLSPASIPINSNAQPLTIDGAGFRTGATVDVDGTALTTLSIASDRVVATVSASILAVHGDHLVRVTNPGAAASAPLVLTVTYPEPTVNNIYPDTVTTGTSPTLLVNGRGFTSESIIFVAGRQLATTFVADYQLTASVPSDLAPGLYPVIVTTPAPGGGTSAAVNLLVEAPPSPDFTLLCPNSGFSTPAGQSYLLGCNVVSNRGYSGAIAFSCTTTGGAPCTPPGVTFVPPNGYPIAFFWISPTASAVPGQYGIHVEATDGTITRTWDSTFAISSSSCGIPPVPQLVMPVDGAAQMPVVATAGTNATIVFDWTGSAEAGGYSLEVTTDPTFATGVYAVSTTAPHYEAQSSYLGIYPGLRYYWRVYAYNYCNHSAYSPARSFTTAGAHATPGMWCNSVEVSVNAGASTTFSCQAYGYYGWTGTALIDCTNLPAGASCTAEPPTVTVVDPAVMIPVNITLRTSLTTPLINDYVQPRAIAGDASSVGFALVHVTPCATLSTPVLTGPADNANTTFSPTLFWNAVTGATSYTVQIATDSAFTNIVRTAGPTGASYTVSPGLPPGTSYYWRVAANNNCRTTAFSTARRINTGNVGTFTVSCTPSSASVSQGSSSTASCVYTSRNNFASTVTPSCSGLGTGVTCAFSPATAVLTANGSTTLNVTISASGTAAIGTSSGYVSGTSGAITGGSPFTTTVSAPCVAVTAAPSPTLPANGATNYYTLTPAIGWTSVANATSYRLQIATDAGFSNVIQTIDSALPVTTLTTALPASATVYWRANASNACSSSAYGAVSSFATRPPTTVSVSCASVIDAPRDTLASTTCTAVSEQGYAGSVTFSCGGLPAGVTCDVSPSSGTLTAGSIVNTTLTVRADASAASGVSTLTVSAASTAGTANATATINVH